MLKTSEYGNKKNPSKIFIFLHGYGADKDDLIGLAPQFAKHFPDAYFVSPNAPFVCDMSPFGYQWFGLHNFNEDEITRGVKKAAPILNEFIDEQLEKFSLEEKDLVLIGFSQGTMMSLYVGLRRLKQIAGIVGFSGMLVNAENLRKEIVSKPPVCLAHGMLDPVVPSFHMNIAKDTLQELGVDVEAHSINGLMHGIDNEGIQHAIDFLLN